MEIDLKNQKIFICFATAILILGVSISYDIHPLLSSLYKYQSFFSLTNFVVLSYLYVRQRRVTIFDFLLSTYVFVLILISLLQGTDVIGAVRRAIDVLTLMIIFNYYNNHMSLIIKTMAVTFSFCIYMNGLIMFLLPDWMTEAYNSFDAFLIGGNYNQMGGRMLPGLIMNILCLRFGVKWWINLIVYVVVTMSSLGIVGSMTSLTSIILFFLLCFITFRPLRIIAFSVYMGIYLLFQVFIVFAGGGLKDNALAVFLIKEVMGKDMTFTNRTTVWDAAGRLFSESPVIGYGWVPGEWYVAHMTNVAIGPHNFIYSVLINGGIVLLAILIVIFVVSLRNSSFSSSNLSWIMVAGTLTYAFMMLMEVYPFFFIFLLMSVVYYNSRSLTFKPLEKLSET